MWKRVDFQVTLVFSFDVLKLQDKTIELIHA